MNQRPSSTLATDLLTEQVPPNQSLLTRFDPPASLSPSPHEIEYEVQRRLQNHPDLKFSRLHVHRSESGICLEGFLESNEFEIDLCDVVREVAGVTGVLNRVVLARPGSLTPKKG